MYKICHLITLHLFVLSCAGATATGVSTVTAAAAGDTANVLLLLLLLLRSAKVVVTAAGARARTSEVRQPSKKLEKDESFWMPVSGRQIPSRVRYARNFSNAAFARSPSAMNVFGKPAKRKVLYCCLKHVPFLMIATCRAKHCQLPSLV